MSTIQPLEAEPTTAPEPTRSSSLPRFTRRLVRTPRCRCPLCLGVDVRTIKTFTAKADADADLAPVWRRVLCRSCNVTFDWWAE